MPIVVYTLFSVLTFAYVIYFPSPDEITLYSTETVGKLLFGPALITFARLFATEIFEISRNIFSCFSCNTRRSDSESKSDDFPEVAFWFLLIGLSLLILLLIILVYFIIKL